MFLGEFEKDPIKSGIKFHDRLSPKVWRGTELDPKVRERLLQIADLFIESIDIPNFKVLDIVLTGSLANYNYTDFSDFDLHIITRYSDLECDDLAQAFYQAKKAIWNKKHRILVRGHEVELYVEDINEDKEAKGGIYSIKNSKWLKEPQPQNPEIDRISVATKVKDLIDRVERVIDPKQNSETIQHLIDKISKMRKSGLAKEGEFGVENLAFKILRNQGVLDRLHQEYIRRQDSELSLDEGLRSTLGGLALGAGIALGSGAQANVEKIQVTTGQTLYSIAQQMDTSVDAIKKANRLTSNKIIPGQTLIIPNQETVSKEKFDALDYNVTPVTGTALEKFIMKKAKTAGIRGVQLAAFLSQMSHETGGFKSFTEYGGKSYFNQYDIRYDREKALELGNTKPGDGYKYRGRGYVHLTGKYNYRDATKFLNKNGMPSINLVKNPDLAAKPEIAASIALWWWKTRTQRKVNNWADVVKVTKTINPSLNGLEDRQNKFKQYLLAMQQPKVAMREDYNQMSSDDANVYYFAYGMLTDPRHIPGAKLVGMATLPNYEFNFAKWANVSPKPDAKVEGVLWKVPEKLLSGRLDRTEEVPHLYIRKQLPVEHNGKRFSAWVYTMTPKALEYYGGKLPERNYVKDLSTGYTNAKVSINQIRTGIQQVRDKYNNQEELAEVSMNARAYKQSMSQAAQKGVLVGYEFEVCVPKGTITKIKRGEFATDKPTNTAPTIEQDYNKFIKKFSEAVYEKVISHSHDDNSPFADDSIAQWDEWFEFKKPIAVAGKWVNNFQEWFERTQDSEAIKNRIKIMWESLPEKAREKIFAKFSKELKDVNERPENFTYNFLSDLGHHEFYTIARRAGKNGEDADRNELICQAIARYARLVYTPPTEEKFVSELSTGAFGITNRLLKLGVHLDFIAAEKLSRGMDERTFGTFFKFKDFEKFQTNPEWQTILTDSEDEDYDPYVDPNYGLVTKAVANKIAQSFGTKAIVFDSYHQKRKNLENWYIEPDGSIDVEDYSDVAFEVVSPPIPAGKSLETLKKFHEIATEFDMYTNESTGLHINMSIPEKYDVLKLAVFLGDEFVLKTFGRESNEYAMQVMDELKNTATYGNNADPDYFENNKVNIKALERIAKLLTREHTSSISDNGKYISFRHAGGNYITNMSAIQNAVGRFARAMIIASHPELYRAEYLKKLTKLVNPDTRAPAAEPQRSFSSEVLSLTRTGWPVMAIWHQGKISQIDDLMRWGLNMNWKDSLIKSNKFPLANPPKPPAEVKKLKGDVTLTYWVPQYTEAAVRYSSEGHQRFLLKTLEDSAARVNRSGWHVAEFIMVPVKDPAIAKIYKDAFAASQQSASSKKKLALPEEEVQETIRKIGDNKWRLYSKDGSKNLGTFGSLEAAKKHEREVQYFKHKG